MPEKDLRIPTTPGVGLGSSTSSTRATPCGASG